jgi:hypothetical protein
MCGGGGGDEFLVVAVVDFATTGYCRVVEGYKTYCQALHHIEKLWENTSRPY